MIRKRLGQNLRLAPGPFAIVPTACGNSLGKKTAIWDALAVAKIDNVPFQWQKESSEDCSVEELGAVSTRLPDPPHFPHRKSHFAVR